MIINVMMESLLSLAQDLSPFSCPLLGKCSMIYILSNYSPDCFIILTKINPTNSE